MNKTLTIVLLGLLTLPIAAQAAPDLSFLTAGERATLEAKGEVTAIAGRVADLPLWKRSPYARTIGSDFAAFDSTIAAEGLFVIPTGLPRGGDLDRKVFRSFTAFSTMKGLQVFSASLGRMETFIFDSSRVASDNKNDRLPDPDSAAVPPNARYIVYEREEQTGDTYSQFDLTFTPSADLFRVTVQNLTAMRYLLFTLVQPGDLHTAFVVVPGDGATMLYGVTAVRTGHFLGLERVKERSFYYRLKALASWFAGNLKE